MARIRTLKPEFFRSRSLAKVSRDARLTFQGLWCEADDFGRGMAEPRVLKGAIWPLDDDIKWEHVGKHLQELLDTGHIHIYEVDGDAFYEITNWEEHQAAAYRRGKAVFPEPVTLHDQSCKEVQAARSDVHDARSIVLELGTGNRELGTRSAPTTSPPPTPNGVSKAPTNGARGTRIPAQFEVDEAMQSWVSEKCPGLDWDRETLKFVNYWTAVPGNRGKKLDWRAAWRTWMLNSIDYRGVR